MLLLHAYLGVAPLSGRVVRAEKQLASCYDDNYSSHCDKLLEGPGLELIDRIEGVNPETGGNSTGLIYEVTRSARSG